MQSISPVVLVSLLIVKVITTHRVVNSKTAMKIRGVTTTTTARSVADKPVCVTVYRDQTERKQSIEYGGTIIPFEAISVYSIIIIICHQRRGTYELIQ